MVGVLVEVGSPEAYRFLFCGCNDVFLGKGDFLLYYFFFVGFESWFVIVGMIFCFVVLCNDGAQCAVVFLLFCVFVDDEKGDF